jgi:hypothetical protein
MTLLEDIQNAAVDGKSDLGTLLRKCKLLAARLGSQPLEDWLVWESNGYPDDIAMPAYRVWPLELRGNFAGPGFSMNNVHVPLACIPEGDRKHYEQYECRYSIATVEAILTQEESGAVTISTGDLCTVLGTSVYKHQRCIAAWAVFGTTNLVELLNSVRNRVLDFAPAVWKEAPTAGEAEE